MMDKDFLWNGLIEEYDNKYFGKSDWHLGYYLILNELPDIENKTVLDFGCGTGKFSRVLSRLNAKVYSYDKSVNAINIANTKTNDKNILFSNDLNFKKQFDYIFVNYVFCCMHSDDLKLNLNKLYDYLKAEGKIIILDPHPDSLGKKYISFYRHKPETVISNALIKTNLNGMNNEFYDYWHSKEDYNTILTNAGFKISKIIEPLAKGDNWLDEKQYPPNIIYIASKLKE